MKHQPILYVATTCFLLMLACTTPDDLSRYVTPFTATPPPGILIYVLKTGDDANDCYTPATACLTINAGVGKAIEGSVILVGEGTFVEDDPASDVGLMIQDKSLSIRGASLAAMPTTIISGGGLADVIAISGASHVSIEHVTITDGGGRGTGVYLTGDLEPSVQLFHVRIQDNAGPGVHVLGNGTATLVENSYVLRNDGGILNEGGIVVVTDSRIIGNNGHRSAIENRASGAMKIGTTQVIANSSLSSTGTAVYNEAGASLGFDRSSITENNLIAVAPGPDYAIYNEGTLHIDNSTISSNTGAGLINLGDLRVFYSTIATNAGNGMILNPAPGASASLENSIVENNGLQDCLFESGSVATIAGIILSDESCTTFAGAGYVRPPEGDYYLANLADNGGPTPTHALLPDNRGIDAAAGECPPLDQRGESRPAGAGCDVGAFELQDDEVTPLPTLALLTVTPTLTPTPSLPTFTFTVEANCRLGPSVDYPSLGHFANGDRAIIEGLSDPRGWFWVVLPDGITRCFVAGSTGTVTGEADNLPTIPTPPLPVKAPGHLNITNKLCSPKGYHVMLDWGDVKGELGYRVYRDGVLIATLGPDVTNYLDIVPDFKSHKYRVEAFNKETAASTGTESSSGCTV